MAGAKERAHQQGCGQRVSLALCSAWLMLTFACSPEVQLGTRLGEGSQPAAGGTAAGGSDAGAENSVPDQATREGSYTCGIDLSRGPDADGDGAPASDGQVSFLECFRTNEKLGLGHENEPDCDDASAESYRLAFVDRDGDGFGTEGELKCVGDEVPSGWSLEPTDCDDADARLHALFLLDQDSDGFGMEQVCAEGVEPGLLPDEPKYRGDCDDTTLGVNPNAPEVPDDGVDSNCDGTDGVSPILLQGTVPSADYFSVKTESADPTRECRDVPELAESLVWRHEQCANLSGASIAYFSLANLGTTESPAATVQVASVREEGGWIHLPVPPLAAGEVTPYYATGLVSASLELGIRRADEVDCEARLRGYKLGGSFCTVP